MYAWFIQKIRDYIGQGQERDAAIVQAAKDCEQEGILADFVRKHGSEAINMLFTQFKLVCRKLEKGKRSDVIAEELEEEQDMQ